MVLFRIHQVRGIWNHIPAKWLSNIAFHLRPIWLQSLVVIEKTITGKTFARDEQEHRDTEEKGCKDAAEQDVVQPHLDQSD